MKTQTYVPKSTGDGEEASWRDALPEEMRGNASLADVKDVASLAQQFISAQSHIGSSIRIPSENAGAEDLQTFHDKILRHAPNLMPVPNLEDEAGVAAIMSKLGRPADAATYALEGTTPTEDMKKLAHEMGLNQAQFAKMYNGVFKPELENQAANSAANKAGRDALAQEWGYAFQTKEREAQAILEKTGAPAGLIEQAKTGKLGADTLRWMDSLVTSLGSEGLNIVGNDGGGGRMTPAEASAQIGEMMNNPTHAYWNAQDMGHKKAMTDMLDLQRIANQ